MKLKDACPLEESYDPPRQHIKKQRHHFNDEGPSSQSYGFSSSPVWMWELDHIEGSVLKNWCFQTMMLEKTLESPLECKEIQPVHPKGNQSWILTGRTDAEIETPVLWPPNVKSRLTGKDPDAGKDWGQEEKGATEDETVGWHHQANGPELGQTLRDGEGQGDLVCCSPWGHKESDMTEWLNNNNSSEVLDLHFHHALLAVETGPSSSWRGFQKGVSTERQGMLEGPVGGGLLQFLDRKEWGASRM